MTAHSRLQQLCQRGVLTHDVNNQAGLPPSYCMQDIPLPLDSMWGTWWRNWLRHCATSRKVAGSIPDGVIGIFHWHNPSSRTMALRLTRPPTEISTRNISCRVKAADAQGLQPYHLHVPNVLKSGNFNLLEPSGPVQACNRIAVPFSLHLDSMQHFSFLTRSVQLTMSILPHHHISKLTGYF